MNNQERIYIKAISRKTKKAPKVISQNDDFYDLAYFENDQDEFQILSEDFAGKCVLMDVYKNDDNEIKKKNKIGDDELFYLNKNIEKNDHLIELKAQIKQQNIENNLNSESQENFSTLEIQTNSSYDADQSKEDFLLILLNEIDHLEEIHYIQKQAVGLGKKQQKQKKQKINNQHLLLPKIQKKSILKKNKNA